MQQQLVEPHLIAAGLIVPVSETGLHCSSGINHELPSSSVTLFRSLRPDFIETLWVGDDIHGAHQLFRSLRPDFIAASSMRMRCLRISRIVPVSKAGLHCSSSTVAPSAYQPTFALFLSLRPDFIEAYSRPFPSVR